MRLDVTHSSADLAAVLKDPLVVSQAVYWVFTDVADRGWPRSDRGWQNMTVIAPGKLGEEYTKTFGHYHPTGAPKETYHVLAGEGILIMQRKHQENGVLHSNFVDAVYLVSAQAGDTLVIPEDYGHSWSNTGDLPLVTVDDWRSGHSPADYEVIKTSGGMAYYLIGKDGKVVPVPNPKYLELPQPKFVTTQEITAILR